MPKLPDPVTATVAKPGCWLRKGHRILPGQIGNGRLPCSVIMIQLSVSDDRRDLRLSAPARRARSVMAGIDPQTPRPWATRWPADLSPFRKASSRDWHDPERHGHG